MIITIIALNESSMIKINRSIYGITLLFAASLLFCGCPNKEPVEPVNPDGDATPIIDVVQDKSRWLAISDFRVKTQSQISGDIISGVGCGLMSNLGYQNGVFKQIGVTTIHEDNIRTAQIIRRDSTFYELSFNADGSSRSATKTSFTACKKAEYRPNSHILDYYRTRSIVNVYSLPTTWLIGTEAMPEIVGDESYITGGNITGGVGGRIMFSLKRKNEPDSLYQYYNAQGVQMGIPFMMSDKQAYCLMKEGFYFHLRNKRGAYTTNYNIDNGTNDRMYYDQDLAINLYPFYKHKLSADGKKCFFWVNNYTNGRTWGFEYDLTTDVMTLKTKLVLQPYEFTEKGVMTDTGDYYYIPNNGSPPSRSVHKLSMNAPRGSGSAVYAANISIPDVSLRVWDRVNGKLVVQVDAVNSTIAQRSIIIEK